MKDCELKELCRISVIGFVALAMMLFIMIALSGCGSHKSNLKEESKTEESFSHQRKDTSSVSQQVTKTESEETTEEIEELKIEYDTDKPVDPATGKHPIKSETKKSTKKEVGKNSETNENIQTDAAVDKKTSIDKKNDMSVEEVKQKDETTVPKQIDGILWALVALVALVIFGWLVYKAKKEVK